LIGIKPAAGGRSMMRGNPMELAMRKFSRHAIAQVDWDTAASWSTALWLLAATYLLATFQSY